LLPDLDTVGGWQGGLPLELPDLAGLGGPATRSLRASLGDHPLRVSVLLHVK
jgi:hypothetical protein